MIIRQPWPSSKAGDSRGWQKSKEAKQRKEGEWASRESERVTSGDRTMIRRPWPCQCCWWSGRPGRKTTRYVTHRIERERDGGEEGGNRAAEWNGMFVGFETTPDI